MLELYHWEPNQSHLKPLIALAEKGITFESRYVDIGTLQHLRGDPPFEPSLETRYNWDGEGPILIHDGKQITEALLMIEYLEDAFSGQSPLRPADPFGFDMILAWQRFINERFMPAMSLLGCHKFLAPRLKDSDFPQTRLDPITLSYTREGWQRAFENDYPTDLLEQAGQTVGRSLDRIEGALEQGDWLVGDAYSLADIDAFATARSIPVMDCSWSALDGYPRTADWMRRIETRDAVRKALSYGRSADARTAFAPGPEIARWG